jgi:hypothetical protein
MSDNGYKLLKVELNRGNVRKLLNSESVMQECVRVGEHLGEVETRYRGFDRVHVKVRNEQ